LDVRINVSAGFHLTAGQLRLSTSDATATVEYPSPARRRFEYSDEELPVYEREIVIPVRFTAAVARSVELVLSYQPCTEQACLAAVSQRMTAAPPSI
jgi:thiol:disulfide interchange protein